MYRIKNWLTYQHYGDKKKVPWIKLHYEILTGEDFSAWDDRAKLLAVVCMLIASRHDGHVPDNPRHIQRLGNLDSIPDFSPLLSSGFLIELTQDEVVLTKSRQNQILCALESESEKESEKESESAPPDFLRFADKRFDLDLILKDESRDTARRLAPGWDIHALISHFNEAVRSGKFKRPSKPDAAFLAWVPKFTKGKRP